jgi:hypothetical protein
VQRCPDYTRLASEVEQLLQKLRETTEAQLAAFQQRNSSGFTRLDKELELLVGAKERAIGAMREHVRQHKCQPIV